MVDRVIPGTIEVAGREFVYIEHSDPSTFTEVFRALGEQVRQSGTQPPKGGVMTTNAVIHTPDERSFCGISYKGDLASWRGAVEEFSLRLRRALARIEGRRVISGDTEWNLDECRVEFLP